MTFTKILYVIRIETAPGVIGGAVSGLLVSATNSEITIKVVAEQLIDFTRHDIGPWLLWLFIPVLFLVALKRCDFVAEGALRNILIRLIGGLILAAIIVGLITFGGIRGGQYFTILRLEGNNLVLKYHRFGPETRIPLGDVEDLSVIKSRRCRRVRIEIAERKFDSFGFNKMDEDQSAVMEVIRQKIAAAQSRQPAQ